MSIHYLCYDSCNSSCFSLLYVSCKSTVFPMFRNLGIVNKFLFGILAIFIINIIIIMNFTAVREIYRVWEMR